MAACVAGMVVLAAPPAALGQAEPDRWFGQDKLLHFGASAAIAYTGHLWTQPFSVDVAPPLLVGGGISAAAGVLKEIYDLERGQRVSARDLVWDGVGIVVGLAFAILVAELFGDRPALVSQ